MKDIVGNLLEVGCQVATDVTRYRSSALRVGLITEFDGKYIKVRYEISEGQKFSVKRLPSQVIRAYQTEPAKDSCNW